MAERVLGVTRDLGFLPTPNELRLVLSDALPPVERVTAAFGLVFDGDRFLMTKLREETRGWDIPGGGVEPGETPEEAMRREVHEETGVRLGPARLFARQEVRLLGPRPTDYCLPYPDSYMLFYRAPIAAIDPFVATDEAEERGFLAPDEARRTLWVQRLPFFYEAALADATSGAGSATA
ncbi:MAG TPA: NUDIX domain-containing protein [Chloroflexota bacterium]|nr:NUDIX domain-containing protein [Chloroflexota bacterium]